MVRLEEKIDKTETYLFNIKLATVHTLIAGIESNV